ncbi:DUF3347 domain-containing protein [Sediminitomix flava]|uniref:Uncharacterized protein DUF3347 n=1 Tax=Sediminitomix flava TaxID=379075 RepID=A0A315Z7Q4_SEDFL|nr:DUF3347 domain-containing protein [Sediminitomix flava]PWJ40992.1 uncharacterized protein DUF3347 [Sediminitomix flava]
MKKTFKLIVSSLFLAIVFTSCTQAQTENKVNAAEVDTYLAIKDALVKSDFETTKTLAAKLNGEASEVIKTQATAMAEASDLETQRTAFKSLSDQLLTELEASPIAGKPLYKQYCPMAFENTGAAWVSAQKEVYNPYFGDMMLRCGKMIKELK